MLLSGVAAAFPGSGLHTGSGGLAGKRSCCSSQECSGAGNRNHLLERAFGEVRVAGATVRAKFNPGTAIHRDR